MREEQRVGWVRWGVFGVCAVEGGVGGITAMTDPFEEEDEAVDWAVDRRSRY